MVTHTFNDRSGTRVAHTEPLAHHAAQVDLATGGAVADHVASDHVVFGGKRRVAVRPHDDAPTRQALAEIVVAVAFEMHGDAAWHEGTERLPRRPAKAQGDGVVGQPVATPLTRHSAAQHRANRAIHV